jgi:hypothetical protein
MLAFARAIQGHSAITRLNCYRNFSHETLDTLSSALATLPSLEGVCIYYCQSLNRDDVPTFRDKVPTFQRPESITDLLRAPSLRSVEISGLCFPRRICEATAIALRQGSSITSLRLGGSFPDGTRREFVSDSFQHLIRVDRFTMPWQQLYCPIQR